MGSWLVRAVSLRYSVFFFLTSSPEFGVFSIRSVLRVASQNWIFASGVYRQFPAPDFNRLVTLLPRRTVRLCLFDIGDRLRRPLRANRLDQHFQRNSQFLVQAAYHVDRQAAAAI
jgi:hypothetical protein